MNHFQLPIADFDVKNVATLLVNSFLPIISETPTSDSKPKANRRESKSAIGNWQSAMPSVSCNQRLAPQVFVNSNLIYGRDSQRFRLWIARRQQMKLRHLVGQRSDLEKFMPN